MICIQDDQLPVQAYIHILRRHSFQIGGHVELDADTLHAMTKTLPYRVEISRKLVHIGGRAVTGIMEAHVGHPKATEQLSEVAGNTRFIFRASIRSGYYQIIIMVTLIIRWAYRTEEGDSPFSDNCRYISSSMVGVS